MKKYLSATHKLLLLLPLSLLYSCTRTEPVTAQPIKRETALIINKVVVSASDTSVMQFVNDDALFNEGWDTLAQPQFWKNVMRLSPDSAIMNIASCRRPLEVLDFNQWMKQSEAEKDFYKKELCCSNAIECNTNLFVTKGRRDFFEHRKSLLTVSKAVKAFSDYGVDPWYAQTILLIESPGKTGQKSWAGAQGPFQLMKSVAIKFGLKVNNTVDERSDLNRSAYAASKLIGTMCIPKVKVILDSLKIPYNETDTWFRLLVLHAYHAGPGNVACAVYSIAPTEGGMQLIRQLWQTECGGFKNESQNYSQLALAAHLSFNEILGSETDTVFLVQGDRSHARYLKYNCGKPLTSAQINDCLNLYGTDLVDGTLEAQEYIDRINLLNHEMALINSDGETEYLSVGKELMRKRKVDDAITVLKYTIERYPQSAMAADSLSRAYKISGNLTLAQKYEKMSNELNKGVSQ
ncbi:MAG: transglycosylase SLT domain-containing protein [Bacteroidota bacterium]